jgi:hypothetical protein
LLGLKDEAQIAQLGPERGIPHGIRLVADDQRDAFRMEARQGRERVADQRLPAELVEHFGAPRAHTGPETGGQDDRTEGTAHGSAAYHIVSGFAAADFSLQRARALRTIGASPT